MGKELRDGLSIENSFLIINEKKTGFRISARLIQIFVIILGSLSTVSVLLESLVIPVNTIWTIAAVFICAGILFLLCLIPSYHLVKVFFILLFYGLFFYSRFPKIINGFYIVENLVISRLVSCYNYSGYYFTANYSSEAADTTILVIMFMIPVIALLTIAVVRNRLVNLCSLILFLPVSASFLLGVIPSEKNLIAYITAVIYLTRSGFPRHTKANKDQLTLLHRINSKAAVWMSLMVLLLFFIIGLFFPTDKYENIKELDAMKVKVQKTVMDVSIDDISDKITKSKLFSFKSATGGLLGGDLGENGKITYTGTEQLVVTAPYACAANGIYLKGYVGSVYNGNRWDGPSKADSKMYHKLLENMPVNQFSPVNQTNLMLSLLLKKAAANSNTIEIDQMSTDTSILWDSLYQIEMGMMKVEYKEANKKYIYAPYYTNYDKLSQVYYEQDLYAAPIVKQNSYEFNYYYNLSLGDSSYTMFMGSESVLGNYSKYERLYRDYVYKVYTKLPEEGLDRLKRDFSEDNLPGKISGIAGKLTYVRNYLAQKTSYTLAPGKLPKGKDFVEYFLYENRQGYCSHYASAAVLMLRAMGVPARYVEGYAIGQSQALQNNPESSEIVTSYRDNKTITGKTTTVDITVTDKNAHAWVEVYIDGCGWVPVEFTPGSAMEYNISVIHDFAKAKDYIEYESENALPTQKIAEPTPAVKQKTDDETMIPDQKESNKVLIDFKKFSKRSDVFIVAFILMWITAVLIFLIVKAWKRRRIRKTTNNNRRVIFLFAETEKILSVCKNGLPSKGAKLEDCEEYVRERSPYIDSKIFAGCMEIIRRARFGKNSITGREAKEVETFYCKLYNDVYPELPFVKKLYMKLILLIHD